MGRALAEPQACAGDGQAGGWELCQPRDAHAWPGPHTHTHLALRSRPRGRRAEQLPAWGAPQLLGEQGGRCGPEGRSWAPGPSLHPAPCTQRAPCCCPASGLRTRWPQWHLSHLPVTRGRDSGGRGLSHIELAVIQGVCRAAGRLGGPCRWVLGLLPAWCPHQQQLSKRCLEQC